MSKSNRCIPDPNIKEKKANNNNKNLSQDINNISSNIDENTKAINSLINYLPNDILLQVLPDFLAINDTTNKISTDSKISHEAEHQIYPNQNEFKNEDESQNSTLDDQQLQRQNNPSYYTDVINLISSIVNNNTILINSLINTIPPEFLPEMPDFKSIQSQIPKNISGTPQTPKTNNLNSSQKGQPNSPQLQNSNQETKIFSKEKKSQLTSRSISNRQIVFFPSNDIYPKGMDIKKQDKRPKLLLKSENSKNKKFTISNHKKIQFLSFSNKKPQNQTNKKSSPFTLVTSILSEPTSNSSETIEITEFSFSKIFRIANIYTLNFSSTIQITDDLPYQLSGIIGIVDILNNEYINQKVETKENIESKIIVENTENENKTDNSIETEGVENIENKIIVKNDENENKTNNTIQTEEVENIENKIIVENDKNIEDKITVENDDDVEDKTEENENIDNKIVTENTKKMFEETENQIIESIRNVKITEEKETESENLTITKNRDIKIEKEEKNLNNEIMQNDIKVVLEEEEETSEVELNTQNTDENISKIKDETDQTMNMQTIVIEEEEEVDEINQMSSNSEENKIDQINSEISNNDKSKEYEEANNIKMQITEISYNSINNNNDNDNDEISIQTRRKHQITEQNHAEDGSENNLNDNEFDSTNRQIVPLHNGDDPNNFQVVSRHFHHFDDDNGQRSFFHETKNSVVVSHHENGGSRHQKRTVVSITHKMSSNFLGEDQKQQIVHDDNQNALNQLMKMVDDEDAGQTFDSNFLATHGFDVSNFTGANGSNTKFTIERTQTTNRSYSTATVRRQKRKVTMNDTQLLTFDANGNYIE